MIIGHGVPIDIVVLIFVLIHGQVTKVAAINHIVPAERYAQRPAPRVNSTLEADISVHQNKEDEERYVKLVRRWNAKLGGRGLEVMSGPD
ncbi:hypothetical protein CC1G_14904 [Coprinopsis cinerea okayama7|uniref:Uncharacterized protein n=1 Tax=Coprinopsis cinerea (strain Okayama-7 / 130 / ATCC MYA-4618 / FGSC 9003) TaxID=240176 RepID=D6RNR7_COPC7|nr:hypothetical protein CC1G_14904 [Coprinopsis cinerea okayama7\|eukprot:XP_002910927.1 hypothetical protein CC1G_14904 [Coprinopsis cinerea okayama7\